MSAPIFIKRQPTDPDYREWYERWAPTDISRPFTPGMHEGRTLAEVEAVVGTSPSLSRGGCEKWDTFVPGEERG